MFIAEKGLSESIEIVEIDLRKREQMNNAFAAINPFLTVPVLESDDGSRFLTTQGCWRYLEEVHPDPKLLGCDAREKARVADAIWRTEQDGFLAVGEALRNTAVGLKDRALTGPHNHAQIAELGDRGKRRVGHFFDLLDVTLADQPFLAGENFSAADIMAFVSIEFASWLKLSLPDNAINAQRWFNTVKARPSAAV